MSELPHSSLFTHHSSLFSTPFALLPFAMKKSLVYGILLSGLVLAAVTFALSGCSTLAKTLDIVNPSYSIRDIRPHVAVALPLSASSIDLDFDVGVDNPNSVALRLNRLDF